MIICIEKLFLTAKLTGAAAWAVFRADLGVFAAQISQCCTTLACAGGICTDVAISRAGSFYRVGTHWVPPPPASNFSLSWWCSTNSATCGERHFPFPPFSPIPLFPHFSFFFFFPPFFSLSFPFPPFYRFYFILWADQKLCTHSGIACSAAYSDSMQTLSLVALMVLLNSTLGCTPHSPSE